MKNIIITSIMSCLFFTSFGQLNIGSGANWVVSGNASVVLDNINLVNNGALTTGNGKLKFSGSQNSSITGSTITFFNILEIAKTGTANVLLTKDISIASSINFVSGLLDLGNNKAVLASSAILSGETETSRAMASGTGVIEITQILNGPGNSNPGNLGAIITSTANLGSVVIRRGHTVSTGTGLNASIKRYFDIIPANNSSLNATFRFTYLDAEKNGLDENTFFLYQSNNSGTSWSKISQTIRNTTSNYVERVGMSRLSRFALGLTTATKPGEVNPEAITAKNSGFAKTMIQEPGVEQPSMTVGPNPNNGYFFFTIKGIKSPVTVMLYTIDGKKMGSYTVVNDQRQQVNGLANGMYILKAEGMEAYKVMVQGSSNVNVKTNNYNTKY